LHIYEGLRNTILTGQLQAGWRLPSTRALATDLGKARDPDARIAFVTPSHQFPMGMTMSLVRRISLLEWARTAGAWILEDDYDSEFRYVGRPLAALQGLDTTDRVIYLGTFSKVLFPALRLGYLVVSPDLVSAFVRTHLFTTVHLPLLEQIALAAFLSEGHFTRHIRRMRQLYHERQELLLEGARQELTGLLDVQPDPAGMHLIGWLPHHRDDRQITSAAASSGVDVMPISHYCLETYERPGILLGYTAVGREEMKAGVRSLARVLV
jgi:GntR family transcriptional regulator / MocR family aminotransferase